MTINEFSKKYRISYNTVYEATYKVKAESDRMHNREYPEEELRKELLTMVDQRIEKHSRYLGQMIAAKENLLKKNQ